MSANITGAIAGRHLGSIFWWKLPKAPVPHQRVSSFLSSQATTHHDRLLNMLPAAPEPRVVFGRAAKVLKEGGKLDSRKIVDTDDEVGFAIAEPLVVGRGVSYRHTADVTWARSPSGGPGSVSATAWTKGATALLTEFNAGLDALGGPELTELCSSVAKKVGAIPLRPSGGVYWLPSSSPGFILLHGLGDIFALAKNDGARLSITPQFATPDAEQALGSAAKDAVLGELVEVAAEIKGFTATTRDLTIDARLEKLRDLKTRADFAAELLRESAESIHAAIQPLQKALMAQLLGQDPGFDTIDIDTFTSL